jgi:ABC-type branched-subunit amino acid transport system ATPase component
MESREKNIVWDFGAKIDEGNPFEIQNDPTVSEAYLGKKNALYQ